MCRSILFLWSMPWSLYRQRYFNGEKNVNFLTNGVRTTRYKYGKT